MLGTSTLKLITLATGNKSGNLTQTLTKYSFRSTVLEVAEVITLTHKAF